MRRIGLCSALKSIAAACLFFILVASVPASAQQYRAYWVDTFNTLLGNHSDVVKVVNNAKASNANAIFVQVRRRGDSWYLNSLEARPDGGLVTPGFDPLADVIAEAHGNGIEVHAYVIVNAIYNKHPTITGLPADPNHVFNKHAWDPTTKAIRTDSENWLTRTLIPTAATFDGYRFGSDFWVDPGHPDAEAYTVDVLTHLVQNYDVDGLHLDRIRYPDFTASGQTPANGTSIGYNSTSIARFQSHYGIAAGSPPPAQNDPRWNQWRRDQVTNLVRRIYLNAVALKPQIKVSAATIAYGGGPVKEEQWGSAEAYWRVYQDWRAWLEEGILDVAAPMNYKGESGSSIGMFDTWTEWTRNHQYNRAAMIGVAPYLNSVECSLRQIRRSLAPSVVTGNALPGVILYSMASTNVAKNPNPCSVPVNQNSPLRSFGEFASALTTGKSVDGTKLYEDPVANPTAVFAVPVEVPMFSWKANPQTGHLMGVIKESDGTLVDAGAIQIARVDDGTTPATGRVSINSATDGGGFFGGVDLAPGAYKVTVAPVGMPAHTMQCSTNVVAGQVTSFDFTIDRDLPTAEITVTPTEIWPPDNKMVPVMIAGTAKDVGSGIESVSFRVLDEYGFVEPVIPQVDGQGWHDLNFSASFEIEASRFGEDKDGRVYTIEVTVKDRACNTRTYTEQVVVGHDRRK
jgi:uncharacterized lipoprotein YddW (UPF0748 family)